MKTVQYHTSLMGWADPVMYQGNQGACGPVMINNAIGIISNLYGDHFEANAQDAYNMYLKHHNYLGQDIGVNPQLFANTLQTYGLTERTELNYGIENIGIMPSQADYIDAVLHKPILQKVEHQAMQINLLSHVLADKILEGKPLLLYFTAHDDWSSQSGPLSSQSGTNYGNSIGGHAVAITSVDTANNMLTVASWGTQYGDNGYFQLSLESFYPATGGSATNLWDVYQITSFDGRDLHMDGETELVAAAFVGIFDRASALGGMRFYEAELESGRSLASLCNELVSSAEYLTLAGPSNSDADFVQDMFHNVLGRDAAAGGLAFYTGQIAAGVTRGEVAANIITMTIDDAHWQHGLWYGDGSLGGTPNPDPNAYSQSLLFNNRIQAAENFAITLQAPGGYADIARLMIDRVTVDPGSIWDVALVGIPEAIHA